MSEPILHPASYRDPDGFIFFKDGILFRQVNQSYAANYQLLIGSGLYDVLVQRNLMVRHKVIEENYTGSTDWFLTLKPEVVPFISFPYEWSFDMLKDAALLTLELNKTAINHGMILKDATGFNVQFQGGSPVFIDTLSFEAYDEHLPWKAYRQFCESFLFPLYIAHFQHLDINCILSAQTEGIPVHATAKLLPFKTRFSLGVWMHVYLQNWVGSRSVNETTKSQFSKKKLLQLTENLADIISGLKYENKKPGWGSYYESTILSNAYLHEKEIALSEVLTKCSGGTVLDAGANDGYFSMMLAKQFELVIAADFDSLCVNNMYRRVKDQRINNIIPLRIDMVNPSPAIGFANKERACFTERIKVDVLVALALIHHLVLGKNVPLIMVAGYFSQLAPQLVIEFIPESDEKVQQLLKHKSNLNNRYNQHDFEIAFGSYFSIEGKYQLTDSKRIIYMMKRIVQ